MASHIHAGNKYLRHLVDQYFNEPGIDAENRLLFAFAGYNAGPNRINRLRKVAAEEGFDANQWFRNVEMVVAREVGREPIHYVANIYKYYLAFGTAREADAEPSGISCGTKPPKINDEKYILRVDSCDLKKWKESF